MKILDIIIILFVSNFCSAQIESNRELSFYGKLSIEANKEYPNSPYEVIDLDSLFNFIFSERKAHMKMDTSSYWKVLFEISYESKHIIGHEQYIDLKVDSNLFAKKLDPELFMLSSDPIIIAKQEEYRTKILKTKDSLNSPPRSIKSKNIKFIYDSSKVYFGKELFLGLEIDSMFLNSAPKPWLKIWNHDTDSLKCFPQIHERNDPLNRMWTPIICEDYLILRLVHSYPDGNQTSFYRENMFFFRKENH